MLQYRMKKILKKMSMILMLMMMAMMIAMMVIMMVMMMIMPQPLHVCFASSSSFVFTYEFSPDFLSLSLSLSSYFLYSTDFSISTAILHSISVFSQSFLASSPVRPSTCPPVRPPYRSPALPSARPPVRPPKHGRSYARIYLVFIVDHAPL